MPSYRLPPRYVAPLLTGTELATPDSDGGSGRDRGGPAQQDETDTPVSLASASVAAGGPSKDIEAVMSKATKAAAHIRLLLHAQVSVFSSVLYDHGRVG